MKVCEKCGKEFPSVVEINGIKRNLQKRKNCLECSPFGSRPGGKKEKTIRECILCKNCGKPISKDAKNFCSSKCYYDYKQKEFISEWQTGGATGTIGKSWINVSHYIRRYLFEKYDNKCAICGWSMVNPYTGTLPLEIEHIDGNAENNSEGNLILLCPNCHSLTKTYRGANKGKGKRNIKWLSRGGTTNI